jgi:hypothetical protein
MERKEKLNMAIWKYKFDVRSIWNDKSKSDALKGYETLEALLKFVETDEDLQTSFEDNELDIEVVNLMEAFDERDLGFDEEEFIDEFNGAWDTVYDWADDERVWIQAW